VQAEISFGAWIARRRKALDLTRKQLTSCVGCSVPGLGKVETDERRPSRQVAELLARCLQIPAEQQPLFVEVARGVECAERLGTPLNGLAGVRSSPVPRRTPSSLPTPATPLIGREPELAALARLLDDGQCRLLTIVGPGGIGKTRLAIEAAAAQRERFAHGVHFVPLASLTSPAMIIPAIAGVLGYGFSGPADPRAQLLSNLLDKSLVRLQKSGRYDLLEIVRQYALTNPTGGARRVFRDALRESVEARATPLVLDALLALANPHCCRFPLASLRQGKGPRDAERSGGDEP
jgi:transcriptional regulator with XRE-family HTH domain